MRVELNPVFSIVVYLDQFHNVDLTHRGYYQIRLKLKPSIPCVTQLHYERASCPNVIYPPCIFEDCAVSKTVEIVFAEESVSIDDCFRCVVHVPKRFDGLNVFSVYMIVELFFLDRDRPPRMESFAMISRRVLNISLRLGASLHVHRPVFFEYFAFSAVTLTVHASLVSFIAVRKRPPPDPPANDKLRECHKQMCQVFLTAAQSLQRFIHRHSDTVSSPLNMDELDIGNQYHRCTDAFWSSQDPWKSLEQDAAHLSLILSQLFAQFLQMFSRSKQLAAILHAEFDLARMKQLGEAFMFTEDTVQSLLNGDSPQLASRVADLIKRAPYFARMPLPNLHCEGYDVDSNNMTVIVERRYLPAGISRQPSLASREEMPPETEMNSGSPAKVGPRFHPLLAGFCLPLSCTNPEEPYKRSSPKKDSLSVPSDRLNCRRMTDPGTAFAVRARDNTPLLIPSSPKGIKSKSISDIVTLNSRNGEGSQLQFSSVENKDCSAHPSTSSSSDSPDAAHNSGSICSDSQTKFAEKGPCFSLPDERIIQFVHRKESFKQKLHSIGFHGYLYSDLAHFPCRLPYFSSSGLMQCASQEDSHLIVFVHGLEGGSEDLAPYRNFLRLLLPQANLKFLLSESNQLETWADLNQLAENLLTEIFAYLKTYSSFPKRISFIAHSMGGVITRCMLGLPAAAPLLPSLHTLLTLNAPHCGLLYNQRAANWGIALVQWWKQSTSLEQLCLRDAVSFRDTFLYQLSSNQALAKFKYVLLVGSFHDLYVPHHSAVIDHCKAARKDPSQQGIVYEEMVSNLHESIASSPRHTTLLKYTVFHSLSKVPRAHQVTGRAAHIAVVDDDLFIEKLLAVSAVRYFI